MKKQIVGTLGMFLAMSYSSAALTKLDVVHTNAADGVEPHIANDIVMDFTGRCTGSQILVTLDTGAIYQHDFGSDTPPTEFAVDIWPSLRWDSFWRPEVWIGKRLMIFIRPVCSQFRRLGQTCSV